MLRARPKKLRTALAGLWPQRSPGPPGGPAGDGCGKEHFVFDHGRAERSAQRLGVPYLGAIPLEGSIREEADAGAPVVVSRPDTAGAQALRKVASALAARVAVQSFRQLPVINVR